MVKYFYILLLLPLLGLGQVSGTLKACPECYGPGSITTGGRTGILYIVDTLDDEVPATLTLADGGDDAYYTGGLQDALELTDVGPIVFNVSGNIDIGVGGTVNWPTGTGQGIPVKNKTIYGQSAPLGGITITGGTFRFGGFDNTIGNIIIHHLRSRPRIARGGEEPAEAFVTDFRSKYGLTAGGVGDDAYTWGLHISGGTQWMVKNMSLSFAYDKILGGAIRQEHGGTSGTCPCFLQDITIQDPLVADGGTGIYFEINPNRANNPEENVDRIGVYGGAILGVNRTANWAFDGLAEQMNVIIDQTPNKNSRIYHDINLNMLGNWYRSFQYNWIGANENGIDVPQVYARRNFLNNESISINGYNSGNINLTGNTAEDNNILFINQARNAAASASNLASTEFAHAFTNPWTELTPQAAFTKYIANKKMGAYLYMDDSGRLQEYRDDFDLNMVNRVENNTLSGYSFKDANNWVLPNIPSNTRPANYDSDFDGMADAWELRVFGNLAQSYRGDQDGDGWTNIEEFMYQQESNTTIPPVVENPATPRVKLLNLRRRIKN